VTRVEWLEANLGRILKARARSVEAPSGAAEAMTTGAVAETVALCLAALRPRNRWPENTALYAAIRSRLAEDPLRAAAAFGAGAATAIYLGFGRTGLSWLGSFLRGPG
jgi:hypothetical protein